LELEKKVSRPHQITGEILERIFFCDSV